MIVAVSGGKGGTGKTTLAWNLARELDAVVVDFDLAAADLPRGRGPDLHDVLAGRAAPREAIEEVASVSLLPAGRTLAGARACDVSRLPEVLEYVRRQFGWVLVDCPAGLARDVGVALEAADVALLVTTPKKPAILDAMKTRDVALDVDTPVACLAVNRARRSDRPALVERVEREFGAPAVLLEEDEAVADAQADWEPVQDAAPEADAVEAVESVAERLVACRQRTTGPAGDA